MTALLEDFVNREDQLSVFTKMIVQEVTQRVLIVRGSRGMGKTYLLDQLRAVCQDRRIACAKIDFTEVVDRGYLAVATAMCQQLDLKELLRVIEEVETLESASAHMQAALPAEPDTAGDSLNFSGTTTVNGDVANRIYHIINQINPRGLPADKRAAQLKITVALHSELVRLATHNPVVVLLDSWQQASTDTRAWCNSCLIQWVISKELPKAVVVIAQRESPDQIVPRPRVADMTLTGLSEEAVQAYWVEKYGLPEEEIPHVMRLSKGRPLTIAIMAAEQLTPQL